MLGLAIAVVCLLMAVVFWSTKRWDTLRNEQQATTRPQIVVTVSGEATVSLEGVSAVKSKYEEMMALSDTYKRRSRELDAEYPLRPLAKYTKQGLSYERYKIGRSDRYTRNWNEESSRLVDYQKAHPELKSEFEKVQTLGCLISLGEGFPTDFSGQSAQGIGELATDALQKLPQIVSEACKNPEYASSILKQLATIEAAYFGETEELSEIQKCSVTQAQALLERYLPRYQASSKKHTLPVACRTTVSKL